MSWDVWSVVTRLTRKLYVYYRLLSSICLGQRTSTLTLATHGQLFQPSRAPVHAVHIFFCTFQGRTLRKASCLPCTSGGTLPRSHHYQRSLLSCTPLLQRPSLHCPSLLLSPASTSLNRRPLHPLAHLVAGKLQPLDPLSTTVMWLQPSKATQAEELGRKFAFLYQMWAVQAWSFSSLSHVTRKHRVGLCFYCWFANVITVYVPPWWYKMN